MNRKYRKTLIAGNWKMNKTPTQTKAFMTELKGLLPKGRWCDIALCVPAVCIPAAVRAMRETRVAIGAVIGSKELIDRIYKMQYSGGSQVQGHEAMEALRGLIYAPVALAIQSEVNEELVRRLNAGEVPHVRQAFLANAQSKVLLVEFDQEIAEKILDAAPKFGAAPHPVGSESKYEFAPMIYRVSGTFRAQDPTIEHRMIRINPMRSGPDTIIRILRSCMEQVEEN